MSLAQPNGAQRLLVREALEASYTRASFTMFLSERLDRAFDDLTTPAKFGYQLFEVIDDAIRRGWLDALVTAAIDDSPNSKVQALRGIELLAVEDRIKAADLPEKSLEKLVRARTPFEDLIDWSTRLSAIGRRVCRIEDRSRFPAARGTGFLVGPDLVLTNRHVVGAYLDNKGGLDPANLRCRFDYAVVGGADSDGVEVPLATQWCIADRAHSRADATDDGIPGSTELDYALLKLASEFGKAAVPRGEERHWIAARNIADRPAKGDLLFVAQHPDGQPLKLAPGVVLQSRDDGLAYRLRYDANTDAGSSGSPCLNVSLDLVALHHAGDPLYNGEGLGRYNQGIPLDLIVADLETQNITI